MLKFEQASSKYLQVGSRERRKANTHGSNYNFLGLRVQGRDCAIFSTLSLGSTIKVAESQGLGLRAV